MNIKTKKFIEKYKELEKAISNDEDIESVFSFEQELLPEDTKKLQLCRLTRNFIQHNTEDFIIPTSEMIEFINSQVKNIESRKAKVSDMMTKTSPVTSSDKTIDAISKLNSKKKCIPVVDSKGIFLGIFTCESMRKAVISGELKKKINLKTLEKIPPVSKTDDYEKIDHLSVVVDDKKKYIGMVD